MLNRQLNFGVNLWCNPKIKWPIVQLLVTTLHGNGFVYITDQCVGYLLMAVCVVVISYDLVVCVCVCVCCDVCTSLLINVCQQYCCIFCCCWLHCESRIQSIILVCIFIKCWL